MYSHGSLKFGRSKGPRTRTPNWTAPCWGGGSGFMVRSAVDLFRVFRVFRGQKHNRIFTTDNTEYTVESQRPQKGCSLLERIDLFGLPHHARRTNWTSNLALSIYSTSMISPANKSVMRSSKARKYQSVPVPPVSESCSPLSFSTLVFAFRETTGLLTPARRLATRTA